MRRRGRRMRRRVRRMWLSRSFGSHFPRQRWVGRCEPGFVLQWHITNRCDHRCSHCYQDDFASEDPPVDHLLDVPRQFEDFLDAEQLRTQRRIMGRLTITGGEPLLYHDFRSLLDRIRREHPRLHIALLTNGSLIDEGVASWLAALRPDFVQLSLEGGPATHDAIRGRGDYQRVVGSLHRLRRAGVRTVISFTAHRGNYREFISVVHTAQRYGVNRVWADRCLPLGASKLNDVVLSPGETEEFFTLMHSRMRGRRRRGTEVTMHRALQFLVAYGRPYSCQAGRTLLAVMPNGDIYPCRRLPIPIGNLFDKTIRTIYEGSPLLRRLRDDASIPDACQPCFYAKACRGGLKCLAYSMTGDAFARDPGCWIAGYE